MKPADQIQWALRILALIVSTSSVIYLVLTWQDDAWYYAMALTNGTIWSHALWMMWSKFEEYIP